jgi:hypothetical protein
MHTETMVEGLVLAVVVLTAIVVPDFIRYRKIRSK